MWSDAKGRCAQVDPESLAGDTDPKTFGDTHEIELILPIVYLMLLCEMAKETISQTEFLRNKPYAQKSFLDPNITLKKAVRERAGSPDTHAIHLQIESPVTNKNPMVQIHPTTPLTLRLVSFLKLSSAATPRTWTVKKVNADWSKWLTLLTPKSMRLRTGRPS